MMSRAIRTFIAILALVAAFCAGAIFIAYQASAPAVDAGTSTLYLCDADKWIQSTADDLHADLYLSDGRELALDRADSTGTATIYTDLADSVSLELDDGKSALTENGTTTFANCIEPQDGTQVE